MNSNSFKTLSLRKEDVKKKWFLVDATDQNLGRMCSNIAKILRGKHKASFTPHVDCGDNVVIINAEKIVLKGKKATDKVYVRYTGYPGGQRTTTSQALFQQQPERIIESAVKGMLPKNRLGAELFRNLRVYAGDQHQQEAQKPVEINLNEFN